MATDKSPSAPGPQFELFLVAHTNVGKTSLLRTLLGQDVGEIEDAPEVTRATKAYDLLTDPQLGALRLWDTPGFGDSFRLAQRLRQPRRWLAWVVRELWDRTFNRKLWQCQRLVLDLRARASVILYPVNLQERPFEAVYVAPELQVLAWVGKPVLVILNQGGGLQQPAAQAERATEWRQHLAGFAAVRGVASLDAYTRCWVQELALFGQIGQVLPQDSRAGYLKLAGALGQSYVDRLDASVAAIADYLLRMARDRVELETRWFDGIKDIWGSVRQSMPWSKPGGQGPLQSALQGLAQRYAQASKAVTEQLIAINRLEGAATADIMHIANAKLVTDQPLDGGSAAVVGGVMSGLLSGLAADLMAGGLTLGTGMLVGGILGATGGAALSKVYNVSNHKDKKVVGWSPQAMAEALEKSLMLYLAVAHFGRGQGQWRAKEAPPAWHTAARLVTNRYKDQLLPLLHGADAQAPGAETHTACALCLRQAVRDVLLEIHPESEVLQLRGPDRALQLPQA